MTGTERGNRSSPSSYEDCRRGADRGEELFEFVRVVWPVIPRPGQEAIVAVVEAVVVALWARERGGSDGTWSRGAR